MDKETQEIDEIGAKLKELTEHPGWSIARDRLVQRIMDLQNINNLDDKDANALIIDLKARKMAADTLFAWLKEDIEGTKQQHVNNQALSDTPHPYILREEEE